MADHYTDGPPGQSSMDLWKTITLHNFHDRLTPPPPPIDHRYMADHYTDGPPGKSSMNVWKTMTLTNFYDRLTPCPLLQFTIDPYKTTTPKHET